MSADPAQIAWYTELKNKLSSFSASDFFTGFTRRKSSVSSQRSDSIQNLNQTKKLPEMSANRDPLDIGVDEADNVFYVDLQLNGQELAAGNNITNDKQAPVESIELQHFGPIEGLVRCGKQLPGVGHNFQMAHLLNPTWCDQCGDFIWGFFTGNAMRCQGCQFTCHFDCTNLVTLDCITVSDSLKSNSTQYTLLSDDAKRSSVLSDVQERATEITDLDDYTSATIKSAVILDDEVVHVPDDLPHDDELRTMIEAYNTGAEGQTFTLHENGTTFEGFVKIHMNFSRPVNVVAGENPQTIYDVVNPDDTLTEGRKTITSFFLPRNTVKVLHISSDTTTHELIVSLLKKFKVADNPAKFALYQREIEVGKTLQAKLVRISDYECPLRLALTWGPQTTKAFVLQENETGDIMWEAFQVPELETFLRILQREEELYLQQVRQKHAMYRYYLQLELHYRNPKLDPVDNPDGLVPCFVAPGPPPQEESSLKQPFKSDLTMLSIGSTTAGTLRSSENTIKSIKN